MSRTVWPLPYGAEWSEKAGSTRFRVAAPGKSKVEVALADKDGYRFVELEHDGGGNFSRSLSEARPGTRYKFRLDGDLVVPDPYTRSQPDDVHGDSCVVDPASYEWKDGEWRGRKLADMIIYELHTGTFT